MLGTVSQRQAALNYGIGTAAWSTDAAIDLEERAVAVGSFAVAAAVADGGGGWSDGNEPGEQPPTSGIDIGDTIIHPPRIVSGVLH